MEPIEVRATSDNVAVLFDDGHVANFEPYAHGFGYGIEGLRRFILFKDNKRVFQYDGRLHYAGPQPDEECVVFMADSYTQQSVAEIWKAAKGFIENLFMPGGFGNDQPSNDQYWYAWRVSHEGWLGLGWLQEGKAKILVEVE